MPLTNDPVIVVRIHIVNQIKHYLGIAADPPDPSFAQLTPLAARADVAIPDDGQVKGGGGADLFRIKIWDKATGNRVYDN